MTRFRPKPPVHSKYEQRLRVSNLRLEFTPDKAAEIQAAAAAYGVSMRSFCQQAIDFALMNMEPSTGERRNDQA